MVCSVVGERSVMWIWHQKAMCGNRTWRKRLGTGVPWQDLQMIIHPMAYKIVRWNSFTFCDGFMFAWQKWHCHISKIPLLERKCSTTLNDPQFHWNSYVEISIFYNTIVWDLQEWPEQQFQWIMAERKFQDQVPIWINWECQNGNILYQPFLTCSLWIHIRLISKMFK